VLGRALLFREALHRTLRSLMLGRRPEPPDLLLLNAEIAGARGRERLAPSRDGLRWDWPGAGGELDSPMWPVSRSAANTQRRSRPRRGGGRKQLGWPWFGAAQ